MRLLRLDLTAYGRFNGESLDLSPGKFGVHLVHGPNEAGKSTLLRAIKSVLFGIKSEKKGQESLELSYRHGLDALRIGALLEDRDGKSLHIIRRKGNKNSLRGGDDETRLDEGVVQALIGLDLRQFSQQFGIHYQELVDGGRAIAAGQGDVGEILFAAAAGLANFTKVQQTLREEAEQLFKPRASNPPINLALAKLKEARERVKSSLLPADDWKLQNAAYETALQQKHDLQEQLAAAKNELDRTEAYLRAQSDLQRLEHVQQELLPLKDVPLLSTEFGQIRSQIAMSLESAKAVLQLAEQSLQATQDAVAGLPPTEPLLTQQAAIQDLVAQQGACRKADKDRGSRVGESKQLAREIIELKRDLGEHQQVVAPPRIARKRLEQLTEIRTGLRQQSETLRQQLAHLQAETPTTSAAVDPVHALPPPPELQQQLRAAQAEAANAVRLETLEREIARDSKSLQGERNKLQPAIAPESRLSELAVPSLETVEQHEQQLQQLQQARERQQQAVNELGSKLADTRARVQVLRQSQEVPSLDDLRLARSERDELWRGLKGEFASGSNKPLVAGEQMGRYEQAVTRADDLADRLRRDATQVAELANCEAQALAITAQALLAQSQLDQTVPQVLQAQTDWQQAWAKANIQPLSPREMRGWLTRLAMLQQQQVALDDKQAQLSAGRERQQQAIQALKAVLSSAQQPLLSDESGIAAWSDHAQRLITTWTEGYQRARQTAEVAIERTRQQHRLQGEIDALAIKGQSWAGDWQEALEPLGLPPDTEPMVVQALLQLLDEIQQKELQEKRLIERIEAIDKDQKLFHEQLLSVSREWLVGDDEGPDEVLLQRLQTRFAEAERRAARQQELLEQLKRAKAQHERAVVEAKQLSAQLARLCLEAGCTEPAELTNVVERAQLKRQLEEDLRQVRDRLLELAGSTPLDAFLTAARLASSETLHSDQLRLQSETQRVQEELLAVTEQAGKLASERSRWNGTDDAAEAEQTAQCLLTQLREQSEQYIRLRLAAAMLRKAVEAWREANQDPVLQRASEIFSRLTLGSFAGVRSDLNDDGQSILVGVRPNKELVPVEGLSCGTCDQLYLAIRLASLEVQLKHREPLPLIVDDCLINFDDDRSRAALEALGQLSQSTQVIVLTHHERLVELAQLALSKEVLFVHRLKA